MKLFWKVNSPLYNREKVLNKISRLKEKNYEEENYDDVTCNEYDV